jgi:hypothetical protein
MTTLAFMYSKAFGDFEENDRRVANTTKTTPTRRYTTQKSGVAAIFLRSKGITME